MKISSLAKYAVGVTVAAAMLAACSSGGQSSFGPSAVAPSGHETGLTPLSAQRVAALTMPHYHAGAVHTDHSKSWMTPDKKKKKGLLYVGDWGTNDVYVFSYPALALVGTLTGFDEPYGMCVDKKGDVFITNFGSGTTDEYKHGGTSPINTYSTSGYPIGCSEDASGDLAVTDFYTSTGAGTISIWKGGSGSPSSYSDSSECYYMWTFGYDNKGNLIGVGEYDSIVECELAAGASSMNSVSFNGTVDFPAGTQWDGKYIGVGDQEAGGTYLTGVWDATLSGSTLTAVGSEIKFSDSCYSDYVDDVNPFFTGKKGGITTKTTKQAVAMVGPNLWCYDEGVGAVDVWAYPAGGTPSTRLTGSPLSDPYGSAVSWGK